MWPDVLYFSIKALLYIVWYIYIVCVYTCKTSHTLLHNDVGHQRKQQPVTEEIHDWETLFCSTEHQPLQADRQMGRQVAKYSTHTSEAHSAVRGYRRSFQHCIMTTSQQQQHLTGLKGQFIVYSIALKSEECNLLGLNANIM